MELPANPAEGNYRAVYDKAQREMLKWFVGWGDESCPHQTKRVLTSYPPPIRRKFCLECWQELRKLAEKIKEGKI